MSKASDKAKKKIRKLREIERQKSKKLPINTISVNNKKTVSATDIKPKSKFITFISSAYFKISMIVTIVSIPTYFFWIKDKIHEIITPASKLFEEENFIKGIFIPPEVLGTDNQFTVVYGTINTVYPMSKFIQGADFTPNLIMQNKEPICDIKLKVINGRLYVSTQIYDFENGEITGIIDYNHWSLYKQNVLRYHDDSNYFEVIDKYNNVVFSITFLNSNSIKICGYFLHKKSIIVVGDGITILSKDDTQDAMEAMKRIKKIYPFY